MFYLNILFKLRLINVVKANRTILLLKNLGVTMPPAPNVACPVRKLLQIPVIVRYLTILFGDLRFRNFFPLQKLRDLVMGSKQFSKVFPKSRLVN